MELRAGQGAGKKVKSKNRRSHAYLLKKRSVWPLFVHSMTVGYWVLTPKMGTAISIACLALNLSTLSPLY